MGKDAEQQGYKGNEERTRDGEEREGERKIGIVRAERKGRLYNPRNAGGTRHIPTYKGRKRGSTGGP